MTNPAANAVLIAHRAALAVSGASVTYRRGASSFVIEAIPERAAIVDDGGDDYSDTSREFDWIVAVEDMLLDGVPILPIRGDTIHWTAPDGVPRIYEVLPRAEGRHYRHSDPQRMKLRIFTIEANVVFTP